MPKRWQNRILPSSVTGGQPKRVKELILSYEIFGYLRILHFLVLISYKNGMNSYFLMYYCYWMENHLKSFL